MLLSWSFAQMSGVDITRRAISTPRGEESGKIVNLNEINFQV